MVDVMDRRVTRSHSNELQARAAAAAAQFQAASNSYTVQNSYYAQSHIHQQQQHNNSGGQGLQHQPHQEPSSGGMNQQHHHNYQHQQQALGAMNNSGVGGGPSATYPRTISDEIFLTTLMNTPVSPGTSNMDATSLGFMDGLQPPQTQRGNSEELFNSWIATSTPENSNQYHNNVYSGPSSTGNRPRQNSRRTSTELQAILAQQNGAPWAPRADSVEQQQQAYLQTNSFPSDDIMSNVNSDQKPYRTNPPEDKSGPPDLLKNTWFSATSPMTRSRSSELRRRYAQSEGLPSPPSADVLQKLTTQGTLEGLVNHPPMTSMGTFARGVGPMENNASHRNNLDSKQMGVPQVPLVATMSSPAPLNHKLRIEQQPPAAPSYGLADVVGLLKGSLERKKMQTKQQQQQQEPQQGVRNRPTQEAPQKGVRGRPTSMSSPQISGHPQDESLNISQEYRQHIHGDNGLVGPLGQLGQLGQIGQLQQQNSLGCAHSPDESSCGAPSHSAGIATSDGPSNSAVSVHGQAFKRGSGAVVDQPSPKRQAFSGIDSGCLSNGENYENGPKRTSSLQKPDHLTRAGSITSSVRTGFQLNEIDGATRKRRVERQRKMAEAKGRGNASPMPADMQAAVKRCDALEKEVRSLKLNLSFMNRKDSEQTKRIEELEQQNEDMKDERDKLMEELDHFSGVHEPQ